MRWANGYRRRAAELAQRGVHGVILAPPLGDDRALVGLLRAERLAMVATGATRLDARVASVGIDNLHSAQMMAEHLLALGHRRIGFIKGHSAHASTDLRLAGFRRALEVAGVELGHEQVVEGLFTYQSGLDAAERLLSLSTPVTAIFASNDDMAAAAVAVAHRGAVSSGYAVPCRSEGLSTSVKLTKSNPGLGSGTTAQDDRR